MADFWIKVEKSTPDKPEIFEMSDILGLDPDAVLGKLIRVWCWMDSNSSNGHIKSVTSVLIDRVTCVQGFADAMKEVEWLADGVIPNFDRHLGESSKKRAKDAERQRKSRNNSNKSHEESVTEKRLDKIREDKSNNKQVTTAAPKFDEWDMQFSEWALSTITAGNPNFKKPNLEQWAKESRLMREIDKRDVNQMGKVWTWARADNFWQSNILSLKKFREKFDQLQAASNRPANTGYQTANEKAAERAAETTRLDTLEDLEF